MSLPILIDLTIGTEGLPSRAIHPQGENGGHSCSHLSLSCLGPLHISGMAVYFSHYIPCYSNTAALLFQLLGKACKWVWEAEHEQAFEEIKALLASAPVLAHPLLGLPYWLYANASNLAIGVTLQQKYSPLQSVT
jgi:hypothetical protein